MKIKSLIITSLIFFLWTSCSPKKEYHQFHSIPTLGWSETDTISYFINNLEQQEVALEFNIRNTFKYKYENLILCVMHNLEDSTKVSTDTIDLFLANNSGIWIGDGWGSLRQTSHPYLVIPTPQLSDSSFVKITHLMPDSLLQGIEDIGLHITH